MKKSAAVVMVLGLSGCAIHQTVKPMDALDDAQVCIVANPAVKMPGFLDTYRRVLQQKGYQVKMLEPNSSLVECRVTSTYTANWRWDMAMYMAFADIVVYKDGKPDGRATYDSMHGGANLKKFIRGEEKIEELVNKLFPQGPGGNRSSS